MRITSFFWALLTFCMIIFIPGIFYHTKGSLGGGADLLAYYFIIWTVSTISALPLLILRKKVIQKQSGKSLLSLTAVFNAYFGTFGLLKIGTGQSFMAGPYIYIFFVNIIFATLFFLLITSKHKTS